MARVERLVPLAIFGSGIKVSRYFEWLDRIILSRSSLNFRLDPLVRDPAGNRQCHPWIYDIGIDKCVSIGVENLKVEIRITVNAFGDPGQVVTDLNSDR